MSEGHKQAVITTGKGKRLCAHIKANGEACGNVALGDSEFCFWHDTRPEFVRRRHEARSRGGHTRHKRLIGSSASETPPARLRTADDLLAVLEHALSEALKLETSYRKVTALVSLVSEGQKLFGTMSLQNEVELLGQRLAELRGEGNGKAHVTHY